MDSTVARSRIALLCSHSPAMPQVAIARSAAKKQSLFATAEGLWEPNVGGVVYESRSVVSGCGGCLNEDRML
jgi:hypothetical protein